jgi:hypothetical protein
MLIEEGRHEVGLFGMNRREWKSMPSGHLDRPPHASPGGSCPRHKATRVLSFSWRSENNPTRFQHERTVFGLRRAGVLIEDTLGRNGSRRYEVRMIGLPDSMGPDELRLRFDADRHGVSLGMLRAWADEVGASLEEVAVRATIDAVRALRRPQPSDESAAPLDERTSALEASNALRLFAARAGENDD